MGVSSSVSNYLFQSSGYTSSGEQRLPGVLTPPTAPPICLSIPKVVYHKYKYNDPPICLSIPKVASYHWYKNKLKYKFRIQTQIECPTDLLLPPLEISLNLFPPECDAEPVHILQLPQPVSRALGASWPLCVQGPVWRSVVLSNHLLLIFFILQISLFNWTKSAGRWPSTPAWRTWSITQGGALGLLVLPPVKKFPLPLFSTPHLAPVNRTTSLSWSDMEEDD